MEDFIPLSKSTPNVKKEVKRCLKHKLNTGNSVASAKKKRVERGDVPKMVQLHEEVLSFCQHVSPLPTERSMRADVIARVSKAVKSLWPSAKVDVFGSYKTDLYLPACDIDLVVFGKWLTRPLYTLKDMLVREGIASESSVKVIDSARVPIIKFVDVLTKVKVDIAFNTTNGIYGAEQTNVFLDKYKNAKPLILVLKQFLCQRDLNEVFTGGVSSYGVVLMVLSFLQLHPRGDGDHQNVNLGVLLIEFFELYGNNFNYLKTGIRLRDSNRNMVGSYFRRTLNTNYRAFALPIIDPNSLGGEENDVMKGCYNLFQVQLAFKHAYRKILSELQSKYHSENILSSIIRVNLRS